MFYRSLHSVKTPGERSLATQFFKEKYKFLRASFRRVKSSVSMVAKVGMCLINDHTYSIGTWLIDPRRACAARVTVLSLSVCV